MYTVSVPLVSQTLHRSDRKDLAQRLKSAGVSRIFLSIGTYIADPEKRSACMETLRENCAFFKAEGFEVGVWLWTYQLPEENNFAKLTSFFGKDARRLLQFRQNAAQFSFSKALSWAMQLSMALHCRG